MEASANCLSIVTFQAFVRPRVTVNCAMSADGKIGFVTRTQARISSEEDLRRVHRLRAANDAIVVGIGTVLADDPKLTVKGEYARGKNPIRVILDSRGRTPEGAHVLDGKAPTLIFTNSRCKKNFGWAEVIRCGDVGVNLVKMLDILSEKGVRKVLVEGGEAVIWSFLREGLADDLKIFVGSLVLGGKGGPTPAGGPGVTRIDDAIPLKLVRTRRLGGGVLLEYTRLPKKG
jgi:2,5-diamino-6-(ribosylamino)-4(3H)-pyrimidinone 5'-phosphate reductase